MGKGSLVTKQLSATPFLSHASGFVVVFFLSMWLRVVPLQSDPILQGYLQVTTGLLAFVFAAVTLVRFQGTQDRISLILGSGFLLSGTLLTASSLLFFQFLQEAPIHLRWAPVSWWVGRIVLGLLLVVALLVEHFLPRSRRPRLEISGALLTVVVLTWGITALLRRFPAETSPHPLAFIPNPAQLLPAALFLVALVWFRRRLQIEDSAFDRALYSAAWMNVAAQLAASQGRSSAPKLLTASRSRRRRRRWHSRASPWMSLRRPVVVLRSRSGIFGYISSKQVCKSFLVT